MTSHDTQERHAAANQVTAEALADAESKLMGLRTSLMAPAADSNREAWEHVLDALDFLSLAHRAVQRARRTLR